jgi:hypothetical protein
VRLARQYPDEDELPAGCSPTSSASTARSRLAACASRSFTTRGATPSTRCRCSGRFAALAGVQARARDARSARPLRPADRRPARPAARARRLRRGRPSDLTPGVPVFALSRFMGTSIAMIDLHYGHLAVDSYQHAVSLLDALALERAVDAGWTSALKPQGRTGTRLPGLAQAFLGERWTLGGRRSHDRSRRVQAEGAD